jgi:exosortase
VSVLRRSARSAPGRGREKVGLGTIHRLMEGAAPPPHQSSVEYPDHRSPTTHGGDAAVLSHQEVRVPSVSATPRVATGLAPWLWPLGAGAAVLAVYLPVLADLVHQWATDENYSHGFLIPVIAAYLVWERRERIRGASVRVAPWGAFILLTGCALLVLGQAATFGYPVRLSLLVVLAGLVVLFAGPQVLRILAFPIGYLLFMIPLPFPVLNRIAFPLQVLAARSATATLDILGVPVFREGNIIDLPSIRLEVVEACSGIRSLISLLALAVIYAYFVRRSWRDRIVLSLSAVPIAIVANAARVALTGVLAQTFGPQAAQGFYHMFSGWLVFIVAFAILALEERMLPRPRTQEARA